jgi:glycogen debranching enzyme
MMGNYQRVEEEAGRFIGVPTDIPKIAVGFRYTVPRGSGLTIAFSGSSLGTREAVSAYRQMMKNPLRQLNRHARYFTSLLSSIPAIDTRDPELESAYRWSVVATDRFFVHTPDIGTSLMAGYATTKAGWDGGHEESGRPGYAWYFGRDAVWTSLALLGYGDHAKVKAVLEFLGRYQDITGKIPHEITTSGHVHYDAADSTPLYVLLMGKYLNASHDRNFGRREFPRVLKAVKYCFSTDTDGDHLIENTNVGHGWVEGGPLFPVHAELYLNACWCAALEEASHMAGSLRKTKEERLWANEAKRIRELINKRFWNPETSFYNFALNADGSVNTAQTILPSVAILFGLTGSGKAQACLHAYSSEHYSAPWGVRMVPTDYPSYNPKGYHYGSIWPLFTGWTALAEVHQGMRKEALARLTHTLMLYKKFALGYIPEVLSGKHCEPAGVCLHQAWSSALAVLGLLTAGGRYAEPKRSIV